MTSHPIIHALGWTLIHSLWQAAIAAGIAAIVLRAARNQTADFRYLSAFAGVGMIVISSAITFLAILKDTDAPGSQGEFTFVSAAANVKPSASQRPALFSQVIGTIESNMEVLLIAWLCGTLLFSLRVVAGWAFLQRLARIATRADEHWNARLRELAAQTGVNRLVTLAESAMVKAPVLVGYFKPVILVPAGMISGLTTAEIETILLHELAHIRRHDFLFNLLQTIVEALFFFNPFVWILSKWIRREREHCCDDAVVANHTNRLAYAYALTRLEEARLSGTSLGLSLADDNRQLLYRIKRIMENNIAPRAAGQRFVPLALAILGLVCASWLTVDWGQDKDKAPAAPEEKQIDQPKPEPQTALRPIERAPVPVVRPKTPPQPLAAMVPFRWSAGDTLRPPRVHGRDWEEFTREFEKEFSERFKDFYLKHDEEIQAMLKDMEENLDIDLHHLEDFDFEGLEETFSLREEQFAELQESLEELPMQLDLHLSELEENLGELDALKSLDLDLDFENLEKDLEALHFDHDFKKLEEDMKVFEREISEFKSVLTKELVKDGYITEGEELNHLSWDDDGDIIVNGKKIQEAHREKYRDLHDRHFRKNHHFTPE